MLPFVHFIFTNLLQLCVVEESGIFGLWELVGGGSGGSYNFDSKSLYPEKLAAFAVRLRRSLCTQACLSLPEWQYFLDKMLWASYLLIKIAAVKEGDKITPLQEKVTDCLLLSLCFWSAEGFPREGKALQAHPGPRGPRLNRPSRGWNCFSEAVVRTLSEPFHFMSVAFGREIEKESNRQAETREKIQLVHKAC